MSNYRITTAEKFVPISIPTCALWLDASDPTTCLRSGSSVTAWNDKSGNGNNITIGGSGGLTYGNATGNVGASSSVNTVSGLTSYFTVPVDIRRTVAPNITVFSVYAWIGQTTNTGQTFWGNDTPNSGNRVQFFDFSSVYSPNSYGYYLNNGYLTNTTELNKSTTQLYELVSQTGVDSGTGVYFNGTLGSAGVGSELVNSPEAGNATLYFGGGETNSIFPSYTQFNEILVYTTALSVAQRQVIEGYLAWKWGLVSLLASTHPYKTYPPYSGPPIPVTVPTRAMNTPGSSSIFNPASVSNCALWMDAADPTTVSLSGTTVTQWRDKSGNGKNTTSIGSATYATSGLNGLPCLSNITDGTGPITNPGSANISIFVVGSVPSSSGTYFNVLALNNSVKATALTNFYAAGNMFTSYYGGQSPPKIYGFMGGANMSLTYAGVFGQPMIWEGFQNGTTTNTYGNGTSYGATTNPASTYTYNAYWIGGPSNIPKWPGYLGEIIVYNRTITTTERQQVEGYLAWKWGTVAGLPNSHPYKNPPFLPFSYGLRGQILPAASWKPTNFSTCLLWLDGADTSTITRTGTTVTGWTNKGTVSVSANNTGNGAAGIVTSGTITQNAKNVIRFPASTGLSVTFASPNQARAWFIVAKNTTQMSSSVLYWATVNQRQGSGQDSPFGPGAYSSGGSTYVMGSGPSGLFTCVGTAVAPEPFNVMKIYTFQISAATTTLNTLNVNGSSIPLSTNILALSYRTDSVAYSINTPSYNTGSDICEIIFYNTEMSVAQRQTVEGYLAWKWGLQSSLPATHPWKNYSPPP